MIKLTVKNKADIITFAPIFETQDMADAWLATMLAAKVFGKPERWVREGDEDISAALETREIENLPMVPAVFNDSGVEIEAAVPAVTYIEYRLAAEYIVEQVDITVQVEQERINAEALAYLASTDWYVIREMEGGVTCPSEIKTARADARVRIVR